MHQEISSGTIDAPSWDLVRTAKLAARMYAPLGTHMTLGDHIRVARSFLEAFKASEDNLDAIEKDVQEEHHVSGGELAERALLRRDLKVWKPVFCLSEFSTHICLHRHFRINLRDGVSKTTAYAACFLGALSYPG